LGGIRLLALEIYINSIYHTIMNETFAINIDQFHDSLRKKHLLCHEHSPPL